MTGMVVKYCDNILKNFALAISVILTVLVAIPLFGQVRPVPICGWQVAHTARAPENCIAVAVLYRVWGVAAMRTAAAQQGAGPACIAPPTSPGLALWLPPCRAAVAQPRLPAGRGAGAAVCVHVWAGAGRAQAAPVLAAHSQGGRDG